MILCGWELQDRGSVTQPLLCCFSGSIPQLIIHSDSRIWLVVGAPSFECGWTGRGTGTIDPFLVVDNWSGLRGYVQEVRWRPVPQARCGRKLDSLTGLDKQGGHMWALNGGFVKKGVWGRFFGGVAQRLEGVKLGIGWAWRSHFFSRG
jgi:hypothetical protein